MKKFKIKTNDFLDLLDPLASVINDSHVIPVLQCVKIEINENMIFVTGDNSEINCLNYDRLKCDIKVGFCVNFATLNSMLKSIKNQTIEIEVSDKVIKVFHKNGDFKVPIVSTKEYPLVTKDKLKLSAKINGAQLKSSLKVANKFVMNSDLEAVANVSIDISKRVIVRSTNKVALFEERIKGKGDKASLLISGKASTAIFGLIEDEEILLTYDSDKLYLSSKKREIMIVQQHGSFPLATFKQIVETIDEAELVKVDFNEFNVSLKRASTLASRERDNLVKIVLDQNAINISCENIELSSEAKENLLGNFTQKKEIGYNAKLLIEILSVFDDKSSFYINKANCFCIKSNKKKGLLSPVSLKK